MLYAGWDWAAESHEVTVSLRPLLALAELRIVRIERGTGQRGCSRRRWLLATPLAAVLQCALSCVVVVSEILGWTTVRAGIV